MDMIIIIFIISILIIMYFYSNFKEQFSQETAYSNFTSFIPTIIIIPETHIVTEPIGRGGFLVSSDQPNVKN